MKTILSIFFFAGLSSSIKTDEYTYYYYPKYEAYYRLETKTWFYHDGNVWTGSRKVPKKMPFFCIRKNHRVLLSYKGPNPLLYHVVFRKKYQKEPSRSFTVKIKSSWKSSNKNNAARVTISNGGRDMSN